MTSKRLTRMRPAQLDVRKGTTDHKRGGAIMSSVSCYMLTSFPFDYTSKLKLVENITSFLFFTISFFLVFFFPSSTIITATPFLLMNRHFIFFSLVKSRDHIARVTWGYDHHADQQSFRTFFNKNPPFYPTFTLSLSTKFTYALPALPFTMAYTL